MNHDKLFDFVVVALLVLVLVGVGGYLFKSNADFTGSFLRTFDLSEDPLSTEGFVPITVKLVGKDLTFIYNCKEVSAAITAERAYGLHLIVQKRTLVRPTTYDLLNDLIEGFEIIPKFTKIYRNNDGIYVADLVVEQGNKLLKIDTRPSDALAIAFKNGIPAYAEAKAFEEDGKKVC